MLVGRKAAPCSNELARQLYIIHRGNVASSIAMPRFPIVIAHINIFYLHYI